MPGINSPEPNPVKAFPKDKTVSHLAEILDSQKIVHMRGTPTSGKSTLSIPLMDYTRQNGKTVFRLPGWRQKLKEFGVKLYAIAKPSLDVFCNMIPKSIY